MKDTGPVFDRLSAELGLELYKEGDLGGSITELDAFDRQVALSDPPRATIHRGSASELSRHVEPDSVDLCISSPPYWNILNQRRTADLKDIRHYGNLTGDIGTIDDPSTLYPRVQGHEASAMIEAVGTDCPAELRPGTVVTDVGSTKRAILRAAAIEIM